MNEVSFGKEPSVRKPVRRWRLVHCFMKSSKEHREEKANRYIKALAEDGFKAKIYAPLSQHQTSGHTHVTALCTLEEKLMIGGIFKCIQGKIKPVGRIISSKRLNEIAESLQKTRGFFYINERVEQQ